MRDFSARPLSIVAAVAFLLTVPLLGIASAHAERTSSQPEEDQRLNQPPAQLAINFSEPPTGDAAVEVTDGCGNDVVGNREVQNQEITARLADGQPGRWKVTTTVVSGVDGHQTRDSWNFTVTGKADCSQAAGPTEAEDEEDTGGDFPVVLVLAVGLGVLIVAFGLRLLTGRSSD
jgi:methionine-rich copper-binding protein CopC